MSPLWLAKGMQANKLSKELRRRKIFVSVSAKMLQKP
jgi:hypothetical protein